MATGSKNVSLPFTLWLLLSSLFFSGNSFNEDQVKDNEDIVGRYQFPDGFLFGVSTSAYQIEGAILEDGRGLSNWDAFVHQKGQDGDNLDFGIISRTIPNGDTGDVADDHYHRYLEDIEILHSLGVDTYRFSISWSRVLPRGKFGDVNYAGIAFYNTIIDELLLKGIQPFVTIHHNDHPQELQNRYGGWLSPLMQEDFVHFAETCFKNFGDRVKYWVTINEPGINAEMAYMRGTYAPGRCSPPFGNCSAGNSDLEPLIAMHNMLLGHAKAAKLYRDQFQLKQSGLLGITLNTFMFEPLTDNEHDRDAANRALAYFVAWTSDPLVFGEYPPEMRRFLSHELPKFTSEETKLVNNSIDFIGINHYATLYAKDCLYSSCDCSKLAGCSPGSDRAIKGFALTTAQRDDVLIGEPTGMDRFFVVPRGMEGIVDYVKNRYHNKPMYITENADLPTRFNHSRELSGYSSPKQQKHDLQHDVERVQYYKSYLASLARAMRNGADVRGYFVWSLMDNFEWASGYSVKFGLFSVDPVTLDRSPRLSAKWYGDFLRTKNYSGTEQEAPYMLKKEDEFNLTDIKDDRAEM